MATPRKHPDLPDTPTPRPDTGAAEPDPHGDQTKGFPTSDRHAAETLAGRIEGNGPAERKDG
jgi:hypothetical protein